ncbi:MAG: NADPH-dependent glutamate synthase [Candidatus Woodwardiibium sp.]
MPNMSLKKNEMPAQPADVRNGNFDEVALGYTEEQALDEAARCLHCKNKPCREGCPVGIDIPAFIARVAEKDYEGAYQVIAESSSLPAVCGRVCPQETQCEKHCVRAIKGESVGIGRLERFVADYHNTHSKAEAVRPASNGHRVAVIGSGPAGLTCAGELARMGYDVTVFEALHLPGGVLVYGIPEFRLPKAIVSREVETLRSLGVKIETNVVVGKSRSVDELFASGFEAVFIGSGAGLPKFMNIPGENLKGVYSANEFLTRVNLMKAYQPGSETPIMRADRVAVVGGGNVAMDAARCAKRLGASKVYIVYRRGADELPARAEEVEHAKEEGIEFRLLTNPIEILRGENGFVAGIRCERMELGEPDASGRRRPVAVKDSAFDIELDAVIMAIGTSPNPLIKSTTKGLETQKWGGIVAEEPSGQTSREGVFAGGDAVTGAATVILAMGAGKSSARAIDEYIRSKSAK